MTAMITRRNRHSDGHVTQDKIKKLDLALSFTRQKSNFLLRNST